MSMAEQEIDPMSLVSQASVLTTGPSFLLLFMKCVTLWKPASWVHMTWKLVPSAPVEVFLSTGMVQTHGVSLLILSAWAYLLRLLSECDITHPPLPQVGKQQKAVCI